MKRLAHLLSFRRSLAGRLTWSAIVIVVAALLITGSALIWVAYTVEKENIYLIQNEKAERVALLISDYTTGAGSQLHLFAEAVSLSGMTEDEQYGALDTLISTHGFLFSQLALIGTDGYEKIKVSRYRTYLPDELEYQGDNRAFIDAINGNPVISPVYISPESSLLSVRITLPLTNPKEEITGVLSAEVNVLPLWQEISQIGIGETGYAYLIDGEGRFIAYQEVSEVLRNYGADITFLPPVGEFAGDGSGQGRVYEYNGLTGEPVIGTYVPVRGTNLAVVAELPVEEAYQNINRMFGYLVLLSIFSAFLTGILVFFASDRISSPIRSLTDSAERIGAGDLDAEVANLSRADEVGILARTFSSMQGELKSLYRGLEEQVDALQIAHEDLLKRNEELREKKAVLLEVNQNLARAEEELRENYIDLERSQKALSEARRKLNILDMVTFQDIQNAIFSLQGYLELQESLPPEETIADYYQKQRELISAITDTLAFARKYQNIGLHPPRWQNVEHSFLLGISHLDSSHLGRTLAVLGLEIYADSMLEEVFYTLVNNSLEHGGEQLTAVSLTYREHEDGILIIYEDDGVGVSEKRKEDIFSRNGGAAAGGMDLLLCREVLSFTGIHIRETGVYGEGARFELLVPEKGYRFSE